MSNGKVAVVTGGAGGIGAACAIRLAKDGFKIAIVDIKPSDETIACIKSKGGEAVGFVCDITQQDNIDKLKEEIIANMGSVDAVVNVAGRYEFTLTENANMEIWRKIMSLNMDGMFMMCQAFIPSMRGKKWGRIINVASSSCFGPPPGLSTYVASKMGVIGYSRALASELGSQGITVNIVSPGTIDTEQLRSSFAKDFGNPDPAAFDAWIEDFCKMQAIPRAGKPEDVAKIVSFFASDDSDYVTGQNIVADGGMTKY